MVNDTCQHVFPKYCTYFFLPEAYRWTEVFFSGSGNPGGGDFNVPLELLQDTSNGQTSIAYKTLKQIKSMLNSLMLMDY